LIGNRDTSKTDYGDISCWDTTGITDMSLAFFDNGSDAFNDSLECWDVVQVTTMFSMFDGYESASVFNRSIGNWDTSKVQVMKQMFYESSLFDQPIDSWNFSQV
jgi:hypothetical protein